MVLLLAITLWLAFPLLAIKEYRAWLYSAPHRPPEVPEDDEDRCRICYEAQGRLIEPCACRGDQRFVHPSCLRRWRCEQQMQTGKAHRCRVCRAHYRADLRPCCDPRLDDVQRRLLIAVQTGDLGSVQVALNDGAAVESQVAMHAS